MPKRLLIGLLVCIAVMAMAVHVHGLGVTTKATRLSPAPSYIQSSPHTEKLIQPAVNYVQTPNVCLQACHE